MSDSQNANITHNEELIVKPPPKYQVVFFNDDFTPFDFVISVLMNVFNKTLEQASSIAQNVHDNGTAVAGTYTREVAETKTEMSLVFARQYEFPLKIEIVKNE